ncbi:helix-turn-helix domain-containing protein [Micromonospora echinospora]|uniref:helix-turn-helix domain-containing protein n=1 Tax=Micromonospora echinospora TaxID=1877 RepID=UPI003A8AB04D
MNAPRQPDRRDLPIGRRVAQLRARRGMSQQVLADRIGRSKSWVDKVERGVRTLDRLPMIETVAAALGVAPGVLLGRRVRHAPATDATTAIERVREALASHHAPGTASRDRPSSVAALDHQVGYACTAYRHAHHTQVLRMLPDLLAAARPAHHPASAAGDLLLVRVYRLTAQTLVKLGEPHLAWLAADRAMTTAGGDPCRTALAAVPLAQALRTLHRGRLALTVATTAVRPLDPTPPREPRRTTSPWPGRSSPKPPSPPPPAATLLPWTTSPTAPPTSPPPTASGPTTAIGPTTASGRSWST